MKSWFRWNLYLLPTQWAYSIILDPSFKTFQMKNMLIAAVQLHKLFWVIFAKIDEADGAFFYLNIIAFGIVASSFLF